VSGGRVTVNDLHRAYQLAREHDEPEQGSRL
jgi:hypothetical protein